MARILSFFGIVLFDFMFVSATDWCNLPSCNGKPHTMCTYPNDDAGPACGQMNNHQLTDDEKNGILAAHNNFRAKVASGAEDRGLDGRRQPAGIIPPLAWDDGLAEVAQRWADQCMIDHDQCRNTDEFEAGQNIAGQSASDGWNISPSDMVTIWTDEVQNYNPDEVSNYQFASNTGHYTQVVWEKTTHVGCGIARYFKDDWYSTELVCNYGPAGNFLGQPVYQTV